MQGSSMLRLCLCFAFLAAIWAEDNTWRVEFTLDFLDGVEGDGGSFVIEVHPNWAPIGAARFRELVESGFYEGIRIHRYHKSGFAQFGVSNDPEVTKYWDGKKLQDDPVRHSNKRGTVAFAMEDSHHRTTEILINMHHNPLFDRHGFAPFGALIAGHKDVERFYEIGDEVDWDDAREQGEKYLSGFPKLTRILKTRILPNDEVV